MCRKFLDEKEWYRMFVVILADVVSAACRGVEERS